MAFFFHIVVFELKRNWTQNKKQGQVWSQLIFCNDLSVTVTCCGLKVDLAQTDRLFPTS